MVEVFDRHQVSFVAVIQQFNTTTSIGRLTLNLLLSFAQFAKRVRYIAPSPNKRD
jgi:site-specific DNA recombinase